MKILIALLAAGLAWGQNGTSYAFNNPPPDAVTSAMAVWIGDTGTNSWHYWVVAKYPGGDSLPYGPMTVTTGRPLTQMGSFRYATIVWTAQPLATSYDVLRTTTATRPTGACACVISAAQSSTSLNDTGLSTSAYTVTSATGKYASIYLDSLNSATPRLKQDLNGTVSDIGSGGGSYTAGPSGALTISGGVIDITEYVPGKASAATITGPWTFSGASLTAPIRNATPASSTAACTQWEIAVDASYVYICTSTNVWKRSALSAF